VLSCVASRSVTSLVSKRALYASAHSLLIPGSTCGRCSFLYLQSPMIPMLASFIASCAASYPSVVSASKLLRIAATKASFFALMGSSSLMSIKLRSSTTAHETR